MKYFWKRIRMVMTLVIALSFICLSSVAAFGDVFYVSGDGKKNSGSSVPGDWSPSNCFPNLQAAIRLMSPGDEVVVDDGTYYVENGNFINTDKVNIPNGPSRDKFTVIKARHPLMVRIENRGTLNYYDSFVKLGSTSKYIHIDGFICVFSNTNYPPYMFYLGGSYCKITNCIAVRKGVADNYCSSFVMAGTYNLIEDCAATGHSRYLFMTGGANSSARYNIFRRCVGRTDYSDSNQPMAAFCFYGNNSGTSTNNMLFQNCIAIDGNQMSTGLGQYSFVWGGFYFPKNAFQAKLQGCIVLNQDAIYGGFAPLEMKGGELVMENCISWGNKNSSGTIQALNLRGSGNGITIDHCTFGACDAGIGNYNSGSAGSKILTNTLFWGNKSIGKVGTWGISRGNAFYPSEQAFGEKPVLLNSGSIRYILRAEGSTVGAQVIKRYGKPGSFWGEAGYDKLQDGTGGQQDLDLWPWPNEQRIRAMFRETNNPNSGASPTVNDTRRGFCEDGQTLTKYIWEYLGNSIPSEIYGDSENATPIASAGKDVTVQDSGHDGYEIVSLDGSGSDDPDGAIVSYVWKENGTQIAQGEMANVQLAVGIHDITLEVTDNEGATDSDVVRVTVQSSNGSSLVISEVSALNPSDQNVTIRWITDQPANGKVEYGMDSSYGEVSSLDSSLSRNHCMVLTGLTANTTYHFRVISQDGSGNTGTSNDYTFTTLPDHSNGYTSIWIEAENGVINSPMRIETDNSASNGEYIATPQGTGNSTNPSAEAIYDVDIKQGRDYYIWLLMYGPSPDNDALYIGPNGSFDRVYPSEPGQYEWVRVEVDHKSDNYIHHLNAGINRIAIGHGEELARADKILITDSPNPPTSVGDTTPPSDVRNFTAVPGDRQVTLTWTNPTDSDFAGVIIRYRTDTWPSDYNDGQLVCKRKGAPGSSDSFVHTGLQNGTTYYYSAFTYDSSGNYSQTARAVATPGSTTGNQPPTASISALPTSGESPLTVAFSGSGSDSDGTITSYSWNFGDGATSTSQNPTHTYARVSSDTQYTVTLTVTDNDGATGQATTTITVNPDATPPAPPSGITVN